jgi:concentrative nucleoside transporter, CNT family
MHAAWWGRFLNLDGPYDLTLELILGYICYPIAFLLGVSRTGNDLLLVGRLIGVKLIVVSRAVFMQLRERITNE